MRGGIRAAFFEGNISTRLDGLSGGLERPAERGGSKRASKLAKEKTRKGVHAHTQRRSERVETNRGREQADGQTGGQADAEGQVGSEPAAWREGGREGREANEETDR